jgi:hypothetical protein
MYLELVRAEIRSPELLTNTKQKVAFCLIESSTTLIKLDSVLCLKRNYVERRAA